MTLEDYTRDELRLLMKMLEEKQLPLGFNLKSLTLENGQPTVAWITLKHFYNAPSLLLRRQTYIRSLP